MRLRIGIGTGLLPAVAAAAIGLAALGQSGRPPREELPRRHVGHSDPGEPGTGR